MSSTSGASTIVRPNSMKNLFIYLSDSIEQDLLANFVYCNGFCIFNYNNYIVLALIPIYIQPKIVTENLD